MAQPVYKIFMMKYKDAWYQLSPEEQHAYETKVAAILKEVGAESIMTRVSIWASEEWLAWGVEKYPDIEAVQKAALGLFNMKHYQYIEAKSYLGVEMPEG